MYLYLLKIYDEKIKKFKYKIFMSNDVVVVDDISLMINVNSNIEDKIHLYLKHDNYIKTYDEDYYVVLNSTAFENSEMYNEIYIRNNVLKTCNIFFR